jgi:hypothetical protein
MVKKAPSAGAGERARNLRRDMTEPDRPVIPARIEPVTPSPTLPHQGEGIKEPSPIEGEGRRQQRRKLSPIPHSR